SGQVSLSELREGIKRGEGVIDLQHEQPAKWNSGLYRDLQTKLHFAIVIFSYKCLFHPCDKDQCSKLEQYCTPRVCRKTVSGSKSGVLQNSRWCNR
uniref:Uncharacterized protein n=1 Tax=Monopterus albus TaxID=43700 RepID=A0A3Q3J9K7_MONAL